MKTRELTGIIDGFRNNALVQRCMHYMKNQTTDYSPDPAMLASNKKKAIVGTIATGAAYIVLGSGLVSAGMAAYSSIKGYQALRDWAGK